jgi:Tol biopolymer transport system component
VAINDPTLRTRDVYIVDLERGVRQRLTFDPSDERSAVWSADGQRIYYRSKGADLFVRRSDFTGDAEDLLIDGRSKDPYSVSRDGKYLAYRVTGRTTSNDVMRLPLDGSGPPIVVRATEFDENAGSFSPDGKSIAYQSDESGQMEVYVTATDGSGGKVQLSNGGGRFPRWAYDSTEVFYVATSRMLMSVPVKGSGAAFEASVAKPLFKIDVPQNGGVPYDVTRDGQRIIAIASIDGTAKPVLTAIINWPALLKK